MKKLAKTVLSATLSLALAVGSMAYAAAAADKTTLATGLGISTGIGSSRDASSAAKGRAQVDSAIAVVTVDTATGKIVKCEVDAAQTRLDFDEKGVVTSDLEAEILSKMEKEDLYNMKGSSPIGKEWFEQVQAFMEWCVGKTIEEVVGAELTTEGDHPGAIDDPDLAASCTITMTEILKAIEKAGENLAEEVEVEGEFTTGLGVATGITGSDASDVTAGRGQVNSTIAAVTLDADGVIVQCIIDVAQTRVSYNDKGEVTSDMEAEVLSKLELLDGYNMRNTSEIGKEWFEQAQSFAEWAIGKTVDEVTGLKTKARDEDHPAVPDDADLAASVTINVAEFLVAIEKAVENAK